MLGYWCMWLKMKHPGHFAAAYMNNAGTESKQRELLREFIAHGWNFNVYDPQRSKKGFSTVDQTIIGGLLSIKGIGEAKAQRILDGRGDKGALKAIAAAETNPGRYAPWACLDDFGNRYVLGRLPEGEFMLKGRIWEIKDGSCMVEDKLGSEKAYFNPVFVKIKEGEIYNLAVTKFKYLKIDSARPM